jgi:serine/threonine protein kinase
MTKRAFSKDFTIKKMLGRGMYGRSFIVEFAYDSQLYAMKTFRKEVLDDKENDNLDVEIHLLSQNMQGRETEAEKLVKEPLPFCLQLEWAINTEDRNFFIVQHCSFGDLFR